MYQVEKLIVEEVLTRDTVMVALRGSCKFDVVSKVALPNGMMFDR